VNIAPQTRWIFAGVGTDNLQDDNHPLGHGTCMLSKAGGALYGTAKKITPVVVRVGGAKTSGDFLDGVSKTLDDFTARKAGGGPQRAVVNMSFLYPPNLVDQAWIDRFRVLLQAMVAAGLFPVTGSGKDGAVRFPPLTNNSPIAFLTGISSQQSPVTLLHLRTLVCPPIKSCLSSLSWAPSILVVASRSLHPQILG
jgi:hypothetical protein